MNPQQTHSAKKMFILGYFRLILTQGFDLILLSWRKRTEKPDNVNVVKTLPLSNTFGLL